MAIFFQDARNYQILFLSLFLFLGIATRDWTLRPDLILVVFATCLLTQWLAISIENKIQGLKTGTKQETEERGKAISSLRSAVITALSLCLLLRAHNYSTMALAGFLAIISKFVFQIDKKHFFNPANFGIISALIISPDAWVSPGQWGDDWWYGLLFIGTGGMVLKRVGRWDTTAAFLGTYACLEAIRNIWLGWTWDVYWHRLISGSLLLFALFMITDPRSIPNAKTGRLIWATSIAILTFTLRNYFFINTAIFWSLFTLAPLTIILDYLLSAPRFNWIAPYKINFLHQPDLS